MPHAACRMPHAACRMPQPQPQPWRAQHAHADAVCRMDDEPHRMR
jgi:hypothetical protein